MTEITTILATLLTSIGGFGGIGGLLYHRYNRRIKEAETRLTEVSVEKARIEAQNEQWHIFKEQYEAVSEMNQRLIERNAQLVQMNAEKEDRHEGDLNAKEERFTRQTDLLRSVQRKLVEATEREVRLTARIGILERQLEHFKAWLCKKPYSLCKVREPEQPVKPDHYTPLAEEPETAIKELPEHTYN